MEFFKYRTKISPAKGRLLVSEPYLNDPNFERTIILMCEHNDEGSFGFVVNKPSQAKIGEVMDDLKNVDATVFIGGPVQQDTLHYLHRMATLPDAQEIRPGVYWGGSFEQLLTLADTRQINPADIKFFLGYSGWSAGQLHTELEQDTWIVSQSFDDELLFDIQPERMWQRALKNMGGRFSVYANYPADPRMN
jgi:putative transcriptional regulator